MPKMSRKRNSKVLVSEGNDENVSNSKRNRIDTANSMNITADKNETGGCTQGNNKNAKSRTVRYFVFFLY